MKHGEFLEGLSVSTGIGIGNVSILQIKQTAHEKRVFTSVEEENQRLRQAMDTFCYQTYLMFTRMRDLLGQEDALILGGQIFMARDLEFVGEIQEEIQGGKTAEDALNHVFDIYLGYFKDMEDELMSARGCDLRDMRDNILEILSGQANSFQFHGKTNLILCVDELSPSLMSHVEPENISGILCQNGGVTSHCAILARASGIPAIFSVKNLLNTVKEGDLMVVDGSTGRGVHLPQAEIVEKYQEKARLYLRKQEELNLFRGLRTQTAQGTPIALMANITDFGQIHTVLDLDADGVGLFRTEYLFMQSATLPTEEQQFRVYTRLAKMMQNRKVMIRTLDIGGDKQVESLALEKEENPFLGHRALRFCMEHKDIFRTQLRAILRAAAQYPNLSLLIPFVSSMDEIHNFIQFLEECRSELKAESIPVSEDIPSGVVIETPSAAILIDQILKYVDFISVGTNDLTQYITASDRGNIKVSAHYNPFNLGVLRILQYIIRSCNQRNIPITLCGEAITDPRMIPLILAFGQVNFSVSPSEILSVRRELASWSQEEAELLAETIMKIEKTQNIEEYLNEVINDRENRVKIFNDKVEKMIFQGETIPS